MSYSNGILGWGGETTASETVIVKGENGDPGIGFKLTLYGNYDLQNKKVFNLDTSDDQTVDDDYNTKVKDLKSAVNKEHLNDKFLKLDKDGNYFDLKQQVIKNTEPYYDGLFGSNDRVSKAYVDSENSKQYIAIADKNSKARVDSGNSNQIIAIADKANKSDLNLTDQALQEVSIKLDQGLDKKLSIHGGNSMTVDLDMGNNKIINLKPPATKGNAANKEYVDIEISKVGGSGGAALLLDGSKPMERNLDVDGFEIKNLFPNTADDTSAVNVLDMKKIESGLI